MPHTHCNYVLPKAIWASYTSTPCLDNDYVFEDEFFPLQIPIMPLPTPMHLSVNRNFSSNTSLFRICLKVLTWNESAFSFLLMLLV